MTRYELLLARSDGQRIGVIDRFVSLRYRRTVNGTGMVEQSHHANDLPLVVVLAAEDVRWRMARDMMLEVWRDGVLDTETCWVIQRVTTRSDDHGRFLVEIGAVPAIALLARRIVTAASGSTDATIHCPADDALIDLVWHNIGAGAAVGRRLGNWLVTDMGRSMAPLVTGTFGRWNLLRALQTIAAASADAGTPLFFDILSTGQLPLQFRTFVGARGTDRRGRLVLSAEAGTLTKIERICDWEDEVTDVYAFGQGAGSARAIATASDPIRASQSIFGRRERAVDARHVRIHAALESIAAAALVAGRPRDDFRAMVVNRPGMAYGTHWRWGDIVTALFGGEQFTCRVDDITIMVRDDGAEVIEATLRTIDARLVAADEETFTPHTEETEYTYQQVHGADIPAGVVVEVPEHGLLVTPPSYTIDGTLIVSAGAAVATFDV